MNKKLNLSRFKIYPIKFHGTIYSGPNPAVLQISPFFSDEKIFALKGGTAIISLDKTI